MLYTGCILKNNSIGTRISVMSRHTLNDGITPHPKINEISYDEHLIVLAPPYNLIGDYYKRGLSWELFEIKYREYLKNKNVKIRVKDIGQRSLTEDLTILCIEEFPDNCHRRLLAEECQFYYPELKVIHLR